MMVQDTLAAAVFSLDTLTAATFCHAVPCLSFTNCGSVVRELGCAHMAEADYALVSSALYSCTWASEMPREAQHVNPDVKLTLKAAAVSVLPSKGSKHHRAQALVLSLVWKGGTSPFSSSALPMQCHKLQYCPPHQDGQSVPLCSYLRQLSPVRT